METLIHQLYAGDALDESVAETLDGSVRIAHNHDNRHRLGIAARLFRKYSLKPLWEQG
jgi:phage head maturation protease